MAESQPSELSLRTLASGLLVGCLVGASNVCVGLKIGLTFSASITSAVVSFALFRAMGGLLAKPYTTREALIAATAGSAAAFMASSAGMISSIPAVESLGTTLSYGQLVLWALSIACLGVFFAVPLRRVMVEVEKLRFPSGTATAETISAMFASGKDAMGRARVLLYAALVAVLIKVLFSLKPLHLGPFEVLGPSQLGLGAAAILGVSLVALKFGITFSPMVLGAGALVGSRVGWSLFGGSLVAWGLCAPLLFHLGAVSAPTPDKTYGAAFKWLLWPGVSLMIFAGFTSLVMHYRTIVRTFASLRHGGAEPPEGSADVSLSPFPFKLWLLGLGVAVIGTVVLCWLWFGIHPWMSLLAVVLSFVLSAIAVRAVGETDINPSGPVSKVTQVLYGLLDPGRVVTNVMTAGITAAGATQAADLMSDLKAGHLLQVSIRRQVMAQLLGVICGVFVVAGVYRALTAAYTIPGDDFTAPAVQSWQAMAKVLAQGLSALPPGALLAAACAGALGIVLVLLGHMKAMARWVPSPVAVGISFLVAPATSWTIALGALVVALVKRRKPELVEKHAAALGSGLIAGEGLVMVVVAVLLILGVSWV